MASFMVVGLIYSVSATNYECEKCEKPTIESSSIIEKDNYENKPEEDKFEAEEEGEEINSSVENAVGYSNCDVPSNNTIKSYMDYRCITDKSSRQYKLQQSSAYTGDYGIRMVNERYCIAVGSYYTITIGQHIDVELENGNVIKAILADCKDDAHTDATNRINPNGSVVEFVVDTQTLDNTAKIMGDISYVNGWDSKIINIKIYDIIEEF